MQYHACNVQWRAKTKTKTTPLMLNSKCKTPTAPTILNAWPPGTLDFPQTIGRSL